MNTKLIASVLFTCASVATPLIASAQVATYAIEPTHTFVTFEVKHFGTSTNRGRWDKKEGTVQFDKVAKTGKVDISIDAASVNTGTAAFDNHLRSADFLDVANNPTIKFVGTGMKFDGDKLTEVTGDLTIRGKTLPAVLKATNFACYEHPRLKREICGGDFETSIVRSAYGVSFGVANNAIPDNVRLLVQVEAIKQ